MRVRDVGTIKWVGTVDAQISFGGVEYDPLFVSREELEKQISPVRAGLLVSAMVDLDAPSSNEVYPTDFELMPVLENNDTLSTLAKE